MWGTEVLVAEGKALEACLRRTSECIRLPLTLTLPAICVDEKSATLNPSSRRKHCLVGGFWGDLVMT